MKEKQRREPGPDYDLAATRELFISTGRKFRPWAILKGLNPDSFGLMMSGGQIPVSGGKVEKATLAALEADGLLVLKKTRASSKSDQRSSDRRKSAKAA